MTQETNQVPVPSTGLAIPKSTAFVSEVSPDALQELFTRDPEQLNDADIDVIVTELRKQRARFNLEEEAKAMKEKKPKAKKLTEAEKADAIAQLGLDLGL